ncbi:protein of unknown function [Cupriavidus taiwanensis]|nr:protein of unknown function [Cupriavidus taiwanensis]
MRARCRHRGRGIAAGAPGADAQDRVDQARRLRRALRHHERGRAVADRHHDADGGGRLGQCKGGMFGSLRAHVEAGKLSEQTLYGELGEIAAGRKPGRQSDDETNLFWHRGLSLSDIALGHALLEKAAECGLGQKLVYA